jgi:hypothetical protein
MVCWSASESRINLPKEYTAPMRTVMELEPSCSTDRENRSDACAVWTCLDCSVAALVDRPEKTSPPTEARSVATAAITAARVAHGL